MTVGICGAKVLFHTPSLNKFVTKRILKNCGVALLHACYTTGWVCVSLTFCFLVRVLYVR